MKQKKKKKEEEEINIEKNKTDDSFIQWHLNRK